MVESSCDLQIVGHDAETFRSVLRDASKNDLVAVV